jgi:hypothetical protein
MNASAYLCEGQTLAEMLATMHDARGVADYHPVNDLEPLDIADYESPVAAAAFAMAGEIIRRLARLSPVQREYVINALTHEGNGADVARRTGVTAQAVSSAFKAAVKQFPELQTVLPVNQKIRAKEDPLLTRESPPPPPDYDAGGFVD